MILAKDQKYNSLFKQYTKTKNIFYTRHQKRIMSIIYTCNKIV